MKHIWIAAMLALMLPVTAGAQFYEEIPAQLRFSQQTQTAALAHHVFLARTYPDTGG